MGNYNNLKKIRELYGSTQEEVARAIGVNRATISQWESGVSKASSSNLEKLSLFFGVGPESFYELSDLDDDRKMLLINTSRHQIEVQEKSGNIRSKADEFNQMFNSISFKEARQNYMIAMKILLATADSGSLDELELAYKIDQKMSARLNAIIELRQKEEQDKLNNDQETLFDLIGKLTD